MDFLRANYTVTQLKYAVAVGTWKSFSRAAAMLFISQPTLSMQIRKLEELLGFALFDRSRHPVEPTDLGRLIISQARAILREFGRVEEIIQEHTCRLQGELRIGIIPTVAADLLPLFLGSFLERYPNLRLTFEENRTELIIDLLRNDYLHAGIVATPQLAQHL